MRINISPFKGKLPKYGERILPEQSATIAIGCDIRSGELRPFSKSSLVESIGSSAWGTIFRWNESKDVGYWLTFPSGVDVVNGPVADDVWRRIYWTGDSRYSEPRMSYTGSIVAGSNSEAFKVGIPAPATQLSVSGEPNIVNDISDIYHERPIRIKTVNPHGMITGEAVKFNIVAVDAADEETNFTELLNGAEFSILVINETEFSLDNSDAFNVKYSAFVSGTVTQYFDPAYISTRYYVHTYVNNLGEEGPPSEPTIALNLGYTQKVTLSIPILEPTDSEGRLIETRRIYRTVTGNSSASFQFVAELDIETDTFEDAVLGSNLGEDLPSAEWDAPPTNLKGLRVTAQGFGVGFFDNVVAFSEPNMLHAWPTSYQLALDYEIVSIETVDNGVIVSTTGKPYIIQGIDPRSMMPRRLENNYGCVSKRSMVSLGYTSIYATSEGLIYVSGGSAQLLTKDVITEKEWANYYPETIHAYAHQGRYVAFYNNGAGKKGGFIFDPRSPDVGIIDLPFWVRHGFVNLTERFLYLLDEIGNIVKWDNPISGKQAYTWRSKIFVTSRPVNIGFGKIAADNYPATLKLFADGILKHTQIVTSQDVFPLPSGYLAREWNFQVTGTANIQDMQFADSYEEIE